MKVKTFVLGGGGDWDQQMAAVNDFLCASVLPGDRVRVIHVAQSSAPVTVPSSGGPLETVVTHLSIFYEGLA